MAPGEPWCCVCSGLRSRSFLTLHRGAVAFLNIPACMEPWLHRVLAVWSWTSCLTSLGLSFLVCVRGSNCSNTCKDQGPCLAWSLGSRRWVLGWACRSGPVSRPAGHHTSVAVLSLGALGAGTGLKCLLSTVMGPSDPAVPQSLHLVARPLLGGEGMDGGQSFASSRVLWPSPLPM